MKNDNYTGYACPSRDKETLVAVSSYEKVGFYQPCVFVENGIAKRLCIGGFQHDHGIPINKKVVVSV